MSKIIAISDGVYHRLKREKGDRSFCEVIADHLESGGTLQEVPGQGIVADGSYETIKDEIRALTAGTDERLPE